MKKIPKKYAPVLTIALMAFFMGIIMSGVVTFINMGWSEDFFSQWMTAFTRVIFIVIPVVMIVKPSVEKIVKRITT
jgi:hypothetical protein